MSTKHLHFVTVEHTRDEDGDILDSTMRFECRGTPTSLCHVYPDCDCEEWTTSADDDTDDNPPHQHPSSQHEECWLQDWFDDGIESAMYDDGHAGVDYLAGVPARSGPIEYDFDEGVIWSWIEEAQR